MEKSGSIQARHYLTCLWPGLPQLWWRGKVAALPIAITFTAIFNLALVVMFLYPQWLARFLVTMGCWIGAAAWVFFVIRSIKALPELLAPREASEAPDRFEEAQHSFLRADWKAAESELLGVLAIEPRDPPALLLLSGVYRHTSRVESAKLVMVELARLDVGTDWQLEIEAERARIELALQDPSTEESGSSTVDFDQDPPADLTAA